MFPPGPSCPVWPFSLEGTFVAKELRSLQQPTHKDGKGEPLVQAACDPPAISRSPRAGRVAGLACWHHTPHLTFLGGPPSTMVHDVLKRLTDWLVGQAHGQRPLSSGSL